MLQVCQPSEDIERSRITVERLMAEEQTPGFSVDDWIIGKRQRQRQIYRTRQRRSTNITTICPEPSLSRSQFALPVALMPDSGNVVAMEGFAGKRRFGREYRHKKVGGFGVSQMISFEERRRLEARYGVRQRCEADFLLLLKQIQAVSIGNHRDVRGTVLLQNGNLLDARSTPGLHVAAAAEKITGDV